jgi:Ca-activated chloride channel family protein
MDFMSSLQLAVGSWQLAGKANRLQVGLLLVCLLLSTGFLNAQVVPSTQPEKTDTRNGNKQFKKEDYTDAEASYKKALDKKKNMPEATFNLGDAVYEQKRYEEAAKQFEAITQSNVDSKTKAKAYHNLGNTYLEQKKWEDAVKSYKEALKLNPNDNDTKYNLAYANAMIVKQKNEQQKKDQNKDKDKKDDKKDQQNKDNKQQKPDSKQDDQQSKGDQQKQQQKQGGQAKLSKADAEKLLQALLNEEQKTNQKMQQKQSRPVSAKIQKDW